MDRKTQLSNVAFGGAWSEQIAGREALGRAVGLLLAAPERTAEEDLRSDAELADALWIAARELPKGEMLRIAWSRALRLENPGRRAAELVRISGLIRAGLGRRIE